METSLSPFDPSKLRFEFKAHASRVEEHSNKNHQKNFLVQKYAEQVLARVSWKNKFATDVHVSVDFDEIPLLKSKFSRVEKTRFFTSLMKVTELAALSRGHHFEEVVIPSEIFEMTKEDRQLAREVLTRLGYKEDIRGFYRQLEISRTSQVAKLKQKILALLPGLQREGRGFLFETGKYDVETLTELNSEYATIAWGISPLAVNSNLKMDEKLWMQKINAEHALEIGVGSGRLTSNILEKCKTLVCTDINAEIVSATQNRFAGEGRVKLCVDDITQSKLKSESFDCAMFWENGLGAILSEEKRQRAVEHIHRVLRPGGSFLISVRSLPQSPVDHLMVAQQTDLVMGIYHTFSLHEVMELTAPYFDLMDIQGGEPRPAGGGAIFFLFRKKS